MSAKLATMDDHLNNEIRYSELVQNMPNLVFSFDRSFHFTTINKACEKFIGKKAAELIGKTIEKTHLPHQFLLYFKEVLKTGIAKNVVSTITRNKISYTYMLDIYSTEGGITVLMTDLTAQKEAESETHNLVHRLQETNKDLRQFAYIVSHNLRAPIAKVLGLVSLFESDPGLIINNLSLQKCIIMEANSLDNVIKDLNSVISAHDKELQKMEYHTFGANLDLIKQVLDREIYKSEAVITSDFRNPAGVTSINGYLYSIMYNLLSNAIKYRLPQVPLKIHLQTSQDDKYITLSISDNGMGLDIEKYKDKIFGLYKRFHGNKIEGKGIGLSLVKAQAEALGGGVTVESKVNRGTTFRISIPKNNDQHATG